MSKPTGMDRLKPKRWAHIGCKGVGLGPEMVTGYGILRQAAVVSEQNCHLNLHQ